MDSYITQQKHGELFLKSKITLTMAIHYEV